MSQKSNKNVSRRSALRKGLNVAATAALGSITVSSRSSGQPGPRGGSGDTDRKKLARRDYRASLSDFGGRMSSPIERILGPATAKKGGVDVDVAIIGSGYGGAICAARLGQQRRPGTRVCLFERGVERAPGDYPDNLRDAFDDTRLSLQPSKQNDVVNANGLFHYIRGDEIDVISGSGLGGTSLINASVAIQPDREVFQTGWPRNLRYREVLDPFFHAAAVELGVARGVLDSSPKIVAQRKAAAKLASTDKRFYPADLTVTFDPRFLDGDRRNRQGMIQRDCTLCGGCMSGCNVGAKNTTQMNYLPLAKRHGVEIYTQTELQWIEKVGTRFRLHMVHRKGWGSETTEQKFTTMARVVVLSAGSLGSTGILLRSRANGLVVSESLGTNWSGNGDMLGFIRNTANVTNSAGVGAISGDHPPTGQSIQSVLEMNRSRPFRERFLFEDGNMPRAYAGVLGSAMGDIDLDRLMVIFAMGHDGNRGKIALEDGKAVVRWPGARTSSYRKRMREEFAKLAKAHGGDYEYLRLFGANLITVHPLGGCSMSDDPTLGVVNDIGQVFADSNTTEPQVHAGLYISDGSIVPGSLGVNPFLTISALSERIAAAIAMDPEYRDLFTA